MLGARLCLGRDRQLSRVVGELAVAAFGAGAGALKELGALSGHGFNQTFVRFFEQGEGGVGSVDAMEEGL